MRAARSSAATSPKILLAAAMGAAVVGVMAAAMTIAPQEASANLAFKRMTGRPCGYCHVYGREPMLNRNGQRFKACGYSFNC